MWTNRHRQHARMPTSMTGSVSVEVQSMAQLDVRLYTDFPIRLLYTCADFSALHHSYDIYRKPKEAAE